uniref:Uncharacterized protein n=1 Tax=Varanus komodoensis TaxID=61221 RepID=A0A8D2LFQ2_VARKO
LGRESCLTWLDSILAEVRQNFENCKQFFYKAQAPTWPSDVQLKHICQYYENHYYFATLYHQGFRIPYWSLAFPSAPSEMTTEAVAVERAVQAAVDNARTWGIPVDVREIKSQKQEDLKQSQALNVDYENTAYDRGHLNPNSFQSGNGRDATFTLTNAVPMDSCFNQIRWAQLEKMLRSELLEHCIGNGGTPYLVTGADLKFSFSVLAENSEKPFLLVLPVRMLENDLKQYYEKHHTFPPGHSLRIFADDCNENSATGQLVLERIKNSVFQSFQDMISNGYSLWFPETQMAGSDQLPSPGTSGTPGSLDSLRVTDMKFSLGFRDRQEWHNHYEKLYSENNMACVLSSISGSPMFRQRRSTDPSWSKVCTIQQQKQRSGSPVSAKGWRCVWQNCDYHGESYKWCSTSYKNTWDYCCTEKCTLNPSTGKHKCRSGSKSEVDCSPQYSMVTVTGKPCRPDHPCGLYEADYYWCYTDYKDSWEHCCAPQHHCDYYGYSYTWCYVHDGTGLSKECTP